MNTSIPSLRTLGAALLLAAGLSACSSGTESGDTNVERGNEKDAITADPATSPGAQQDTAVSQQERMYENTSTRKDHNNDGKADQ